MGITATTPQSLQVLDSSKTWVPMGVIDPATHTWTMPALTSPQIAGQLGVNIAGDQWANTYYYAAASSLFVQSNSTFYDGSTSATKTSLYPGTDQQNIIADTVLAIDDNANHAQNLWGRYTQVGVLNFAATNGQKFGEESSLAWFGSSNAASLDPYNSIDVVNGSAIGVKYDAGYGGGVFTLGTLTGDGATATATVTSLYGTALFATGYLLTVNGASISGFNGKKPVTVINATQFTYPCACSGAPTGTITATITPNDASVAILVGSNGGQFRRGVVFTAGALDTAAGGGTSDAIAMAQSQSVTWYGAAATPLAKIFSNTASGDLDQLIFGTNQLQAHIGNVDAFIATEKGTTFGGPIIENFNSAGAFPTATNINGGAIAWNFSDANQEVDFFNSAFSATGFNSFYFLQQTGPSAYTLLARLGPSGFTLPVPLSVTNDGPNWASPGTSIYDYNRTAINSFPLNAEFGSGTVPVVQSVVGAIDIPSNSTVYQAHGLAGYARTNGSATFGVGIFGQYTMGAAGGSGNGGNCIAINGPVQTATIGFSGGNMLGCEADVNVLPLASAVAPALNVYGFWAAGGSHIQPTGEFDGYHLEPAGSGIQWKNGFYMRDGSASTAINIGAISSANGVGSMPVLYRARTTGGINNTGDMYL